MLCISSHGQTTPEKDLSNPWYGKGFCEPQQYKSATDRCEGGYKSLELGIDIFKRLHKITESYSAALREWSTDSQKQISESKEFGTNKVAWLHSIRAVETKLTEENNCRAKGVQENVVDKMNAYKNENYGKSFIHVRKIKEFDKDFKKVQKTWLEFVDKINDAKQAYHTAKRKLQLAERAANVTKTDVGSSDERQKKADASVEHRTTETDTCKTKYTKLIKEMESKKDAYEEDMFKILKRTDEFEAERLKHFKTILIGLKEATLIKTENDETHKKALEDAIEKQNITEDINFFNKHYGRETKTKWPVFEELEE